MPTSSSLQSIVQKVWPEHTDALDDADFLQRIEAQSASGGSPDDLIKTAKGGDSFDWAQTIKILHEAFKFTAELLAIYAALQKVSAARVSSRELAEEIRKQKVDQKYSPPVAQQLETVAKEVAQ